MKISIVFSCLFVVFASFYVSPYHIVKSKTFSTCDSIVTPKHFVKIKTAMGDLDKDNIDEKVVVYNTKKGENGYERAIYMYKNKNGAWELWRKTRGAILPSQDEIDENDSFADLRITNGCIVIEHTGLDGERWAYTHKYRFQNNDFLLIGATLHRYYICSGSTNFDYNLLTGKIIYDRAETVCKDGAESENLPEKHKVFMRKKEKSASMDGYTIGENSITLEKNLSFEY